MDSCGRLSAGVLHIVDLYNGHRMVGVFGVCVCVCVCVITGLSMHLNWDLRYVT